jgi:hypothetical protein
MTDGNDNRPNRCSAVPPLGDGTAEQRPDSRNGIGTQAERLPLKDLALLALDRNGARNGARNRAGTAEFHSEDQGSSAVPHSFRRQMPDPRHLDAICRRAVSDYPGVDAGRLREFLQISEDPAWCTERIARQIARRMAEGLI